MTDRLNVGMTATCLQLNCLDSLASPWEAAEVLASRAVETDDADLLSGLGSFLQKHLVKPAAYTPFTSLALTTLHAAMSEGAPNVIKILLQPPWLQPEMVSSTWKAGGEFARESPRSALSQACAAGNSALVDLLLAAGASPHGLPGEVDMDAWFLHGGERMWLLPPWQAAISGEGLNGTAADCADCLSSLMTAGWDPLAAERTGPVPPLVLAARADNVPALTLLLDRGCDPTKTKWIGGATSWLAELVPVFEVAIHAARKISESDVADVDVWHAERMEVLHRMVAFPGFRWKSKDWKRLDASISDEDEDLRPLARRLLEPVLLSHRQVAKPRKVRARVGM